MTIVFYIVGVYENFFVSKGENRNMVKASGIEPETPKLKVSCSIHLS